MALSDCIECWDTPCICGYDYRSWSEEKLQSQIKMLQNVLELKKKAREKSG